MHDFGRDDIFISADFFFIGKEVSWQNINFRKWNNRQILTLIILSMTGHLKSYNELPARPRNTGYLFC